MRKPPLLLMLIMLACGTSSAQQTVAYKCVGADGSIGFQDSPCPQREQQKTLHLSAPPATAATTQLAEPPVPAPKSPPAHPQQPLLVEPVELPRLFACVRATDGKPYVSHNGQPRPYLAPFGILGAYQQPLAQVYGGRGAAGASAPELNRGRVTPGLIGNNYVWVQDVCREMSVQEICTELHHEYDANEHTLRNAFKSDKPPLEKREAELRHQLQACDG